jgi:hypothetical protein
MLDMHAGLGFYQPSGKEGTNSTSSMQKIDPGMPKSCSI